MSWLDKRSSAGYLDLSEARFDALVKSGKFPRPSYHLGQRSPRWNSEALDRSMEPATNSKKATFDGLGAEIAAENEARKAAARRRVSQDLHVRTQESSADVGGRDGDSAH